MIRKLTLLAGLGAGYVLGAKAGTQRYEQIMGKARELAGRPQVQDATAHLKATVADVADTAVAKANDTLSGVSGRTVGGGSDVVDLTEGVSTTGYSTTGYDTGPSPMPGAAASDSV